MIYRLNSDGYGQVSNSVALPQVSGVAVKRFFWGSGNARVNIKGCDRSVMGPNDRYLSSSGRCVRVSNHWVELRLWAMAQ
jgi:hypothetical protein